MWIIKFNSKRRGIFLSELITVMAVFVIMLVPISRLVATLVRDVPESYSIYQKNETLLDAVLAIRKDVAGSVAVEVVDDQLVIDGGRVSYVFDGNVMSRKMRDDVKSWNMAGVVMNFETVLCDDVRALKVSAYVPVLVQGRERKKLFNNYLMFPGILTVRGEEL